jgi:hypothetical protein
MDRTRCDWGFDEPEPELPSEIYSVPRKRLTDDDLKEICQLAEGVVLMTHNGEHRVVFTARDPHLATLYARWKLEQWDDREKRS